MAGKIIADQIEHSTAGSLDTSYVVNGSAKAWVNFNGSGTVAIQKSHNTSSITDSGTGQYVVNLSSSIDSANYVININSNGWHQVPAIGGAGGSLTSGAAAIRLRNASSPFDYTDAAIVVTSIQGDLA
jgi:hypothetical protein